MSREERRAYQRMTKKQDPYALPATGAARARQQQLERRKAQRSASVTAPPGAISRRFLAWAVGGAAVSGLVAFSLAWPSGMPFAAYVGAGVAVAWVAVAFGLRALGRRNPVRP
ncbi:MAG: hypothetical protein H0W81_03175 [Chloroflexi bacterium]|nr:hypothetical protein [Chloroflexota bacterium]